MPPSASDAGVHTFFRTSAGLEDAYLTNALITLHREEWSVYDARKLYRTARHAGLDVGRDQVARLMRLAGACPWPARHHHDPLGSQRPRHPDLVGRGRDVPRTTDGLWVADSSYVWSMAGFSNVALVVDVHSRRILGWRVIGSDADPAGPRRLPSGLHTRHRGAVNPDATWTTHRLVHHSDAGSQVRTSGAFTAELIEAGIAGSIGTVGDALDKALCWRARLRERGYRLTPSGS
jgi:transposase InsO family protein